MARSDVATVRWSGARVVAPASKTRALRYVRSVEERHEGNEKDCTGIQQSKHGLNPCY